MVNRVIELKTDVSSNATETLLGTEEPRQGVQLDVQEIYGRFEGEGTVTIEIDERAVIDGVDTQAFPSVSERLVTNYSLEAGRALRAIGSDESGSQNEMAVYLVVDETQEQG